jgi:hypothetical protein
VRPDGFIRLHQTDAGGTLEHIFFLEVDRSTEVLDTLVTRCQCYRDFYRRGGLAIRNGRPPEEFEKFPFRVLIVARIRKRRNNLSKRLLSLHPPILSQVWLSTMAETETNLFGAVWTRPIDYRYAHTRRLSVDAVQGADPPDGNDRSLEPTIARHALFEFVQHSESPTNAPK